LYRSAPVAAPALRPLGIGEILDVSLKLTWRNFGTLARIVLCVIAPAELLIAIVDVSAVPNYKLGSTLFTTTTQTTYTQSEVWTRLAASLVALLIGFLANSVATGASFRAIAETYLGLETDWRSSLAFAGRKLGSILWITLLSAVLELLGALLCILPGIYLYVSFAVAFPVLMSEGQRGRKALGRSRELVRGRWWRTFLLLVVATLLISVITSVISGLIDALVFAGDSNVVEVLLVTAVAGTLAALVTTPFGAAYHTVLYFDLRVRKEAFDLRLLAGQIGVSPPPGWEPPPPSVPPGGQPPFWPPPPGWQPSSDPAAAPAPIWPPPPGPPS
jgi:uncharacterized membrane protein